MESVERVLAHGGTPTSTAALDQTDFSVFDKQCLTCRAVKKHSQFRSDHTYRDGRRDQCLLCESSPRLSNAEHVARLREQNYYDVRTKNQRGPHALDWVDEEPRWGRQMHAFEFLYHLKKLTGDQGQNIFVMEGNIVGDLALFRFRRPYQDPEYLMYVPYDYTMPEFSIMEWDHRDVPVREEFRGWRTILLRLIRSGVVTEEGCNRVFGEATGPANVPWRREMFVMRNSHE